LKSTGQFAPPLDGLVTIAAVKSLSYLVLIFVAGVSAHGLQDVVPARLASAKTACIKQLNGSKQDVAEVKRQLKSWGRFQLKDDCSGADVAIWLSARYSPENKVCGTRLQVIGNPDNAILWSGAQGCKTQTAPAIGKMMRKLRTDVSGEKQPTAKTASKPAAKK
jgi:hypothetical protein